MSNRKKPHDSKFQHLKFYLLVALGLIVASTLLGFALMLQEDSPVFTDNFLERFLRSSIIGFIVGMIIFLFVYFSGKPIRQKRKSKDEHK
jgi:hypothetical protein